MNKGVTKEIPRVFFHSAADYITAELNCQQSKWVSSSIVKGRLICVYGIDIAISTDKDGKAQLVPIIPCMKAMMKLIKAHPEARQFQWVKNKLKWMLA